jgi:fructose-bisphosphate aldolase, class II
MTVATLRDVLLPALAARTAFVGVVVQGWEDARAYVDAAEAEGVPLILQCGPGARAHMPLRVFGAMFRVLMEGASVPVVAHLDHGEGLSVCQEAIDRGFTSVMFDGSAMDISQNVALTSQIVAMAHAAGVSVEAEVGFVGYAGGAASAGTVPEEAALMQTTGIDALAVAVGNTHLMTSPGGVLDWHRLRAIEAACPGLPLVLHGGSGLSADLRKRLARESAVCKFNVGTELRQAFGAALRGVLAADAGVFDRNAILGGTIGAMRDAARGVMGGLGFSTHQ